MMKLCNNLMTKIAAFVLICGVVLLAGAPPVAAANVNIPDANLRKAINKALGANRAATAAVTEAEMKTLTSLTARNASISDLTGVEKATNLTTLGLHNNSISDISPLVSNTGLGTGDTVNLSSNPLSYPSIFTHIPALQTRGVTVSFNNRVPTTLTKVSGDARTTAGVNILVVEVKDNASPAKGFEGVPVTFAVTGGGGALSATNVATGATGQAQVTLTPGTTGSNTVTATVTHAEQTLSVSFTSEAGVNIRSGSLRRVINRALGASRAADAAVSGTEMKTLTSLEPGGWGINSITGLETATNLTTLYLYNNALSDISALSGLTNLSRLGLEGNSISSISDLSGLTNLTTLNLQSNSISDISPLISNTGLGSGDSVNLSNNPLSYPSIFTHIPALKLRGVTVYFDGRTPHSNALTKVSGDTQTGATRTPLASPFVVEVKDSASKTFEGVPVTFAITAGGGTLSATSVATDATGRAQTTLTLGPTTGTNTVTATVIHTGRWSTRTFSVSFTANASGHPPVFTSAATFSVAENTTAVGTVVATDADTQDSITGYTLSGADSAKFSITNAGVLTFAASPDYDSPSDLISTEPANAAGNNEYVIVVTATSGTGARELTATQPLTITVTNVNEPPAQPAAPTGTAATATPTSLNVRWTAPRNTGPAITAYNLRYRKNSEVSWTRSNYPGTATNTTLTGLTAGTTYEVQVMAQNAEGSGPWSNTGSVLTAANAVPVFTNAATFSVVENTTAVGTVTATDADTQDSVTGYTLSGGADSAKFAITNTGVLTFTAAPNYDAPGDVLSATPANAAGNNRYIVVVTATSGTGARVQTATQTLTITVTDVPPPGKPAAPTVTVDSHTSVSVTWAAPTNTGPAINEYNVQYRAGTTGTFIKWPHTGTAKTTTITGLAAGTSYQVQVRAASAEGKGPWSDASAAATTTYQAEDVDADGDVDTMDLVTVVNNFGSPTPGRNDVDNNGTVDAADVRAVFNAVLAAEAEAAPARAQTRITHTAKTLHHYVQTTKQDRMLDANVYRGLAVLEELIEPFLLPDETALLRNYPNPFNPETWFPYQLSSAADVTFAIYSVNGTLVRTLSLGHQAAGVYRSKSRAAYWDGRNAFGEPVASGIYFYTLTAGDFTATGKMLIRK